MNYSIITICLNSAGTIKRTMDSVLSQTVLPAEYIFVDGGSEDDTLDIIKKTIAHHNGKKNDVNFKILNQDDGTGIADAWNRGLREVTSEWIFILNSDDWYEKTCAQEVLDTAKTHLQSEIIVGSTQVFAENDKGKPKHYKNRPFFMFPFLNPINHPACFIKKTVYDEIGEYNNLYKVAADYDFLYRCIKKRKNIVSNPNIMVNRLGGGFAERNREISREELRFIAKQYCSFSVLPSIAYCLRRALGR